MKDILIPNIQTLKIENPELSIIITWDFNTPYPNDRIQIEDFRKSTNLTCHVDEPTHCNGGTLDLCFSIISMLTITLCPVWFTDHFLMGIQIST